MPQQVKVATTGHRIAPSFPAPDLLKLVSPASAFENERELQYVVSLSKLRSVLDLRRLPAATIQQNYFPDREVPGIVEVICRKQEISPHMLSDHEFTSARIRAITVEGNVTLFLQAKGPKEKEKGTRLTRPEISAIISPNEYGKFISIATSGAIFKTRALLAGAVEHKTLGMIKIVAEIDCFHSLGTSYGLNPGINDGVSDQLDFARIDIELPRRKLIKPMVKGAHTFEFLKFCGAVELGRCDKEIRKAFSTRRLAESGVDERFINALQTLRGLSARRTAA